eukprot:TRINITY_DN37106_c0_g1_i1.p1 TRINITY_DN37106_c0_g1~~TRINITY_DN37106_c0_g1_i1.p1  ORF type:complete len:126 (-),score=19.44 TRINITY_DN37106_c0_g1_i1:103-480(-)
MIYTLHVFARGRKLLCKENWHRTRPCADEAEETKLISGLLLTLKSFVQQLGPPGKPSRFMSYCTPQYKLHAFETASGYWFAMTTDVSVPDQQECLRHIYAELFVEHVLKNPLYRLGEDLSSCVIF